MLTVGGSPCNRPAPLGRRHDDVGDADLGEAGGERGLLDAERVRHHAAVVAQEEQQQEFNRLAEQTALYEITSYAGEVREQADVRIPEVVLDPPLFY